MKSERMKSLIPAVIIIGMFLVLFAITNGDAGVASVDVGKFRITIDDVASGEDYFVKRLEIQANEASGMRLTHGDNGGAWISLDNHLADGDSTADARVVIMLDMSHPMRTDQRTVTFLLKLGRKSGGGAGGPSRYSVPADTKMDELITLNLPEGEFDVGSVLSLGEFQGEPITLEVER